MALIVLSRDGQVEEEENTVIAVDGGISVFCLMCCHISIRGNEILKFGECDATILLSHYVFNRDAKKRRI